MTMRGDTILVILMNIEEILKSQVNPVPVLSQVNQESQEKEKMKNLPESFAQVTNSSKTWRGMIPDSSLYTVNISVSFL